MDIVYDRAGVACLVHPSAHRDGGTLRTRASIAALQAAGFEVDVFAPVLRAAGSSGPQGSGRLGVWKRHFLPMPLARAQPRRQLAEFADSHEVVLSSALAQTGHVAHASKLWIDFMDVWSSVARREGERRSHPAARATSLLQANLLRLRERRYAEAAALVTTAGWSDHLELAARGIRSEWWPTALPDAEFATVPRHEGPPAVGLLGNYHYWPNVDAFRALVKFWLAPLQKSGFEVIVAGRGADTLGDVPPGVKIMSDMDDLDEFYSAVDYTIAPIRLGGGIKVKVIESLARGIPIVGTRFAFDGFPPEYHRFFHEVPLVSGAKLDLSGAQRRIDRNDPLLSIFRESFSVAQMGSLLEERMSEALVSRSR